MKRRHAAGHGRGKSKPDAGVDCQRVVRVGNKPYGLNIDAAEGPGCDLIFVASHGRRGVSALLPRSETQAASGAGLPLTSSRRARSWRSNRRSRAARRRRR